MVGPGMAVARVRGMRTTAFLAATAVTASLLTGCTDDLAGDDPEDSVFVDDSKADDFFSTSAVEYLLQGSSTVVLDASWATRSAADRLKEATRLVGLKQIAVAWFVTQYLVNKEHDDPNASFGGFGGMAKAGAYEDLSIRERADKLTFDFTFRQIAAGGKNLMSQLPVRIAGGKQVFDLEIGKPSNTELAQLETNAEWYRSAPWSGWNPAAVAADTDASDACADPRAAPPGVICTVAGVPGGAGVGRRASRAGRRCFSWGASSSPASRRGCLRPRRCGLGRACRAQHLEARPPGGGDARGRRRRRRWGSLGGSDGPCSTRCGRTRPRRSSSELVVRPQSLEEQPLPPQLRVCRRY